MKFSLDKHLDVDLQYIFGSKWNVNAEDLQNYEAVISNAAKRVQRIRETGKGPGGKAVLFSRLPYILDENVLMAAEERLRLRRLLGILRKYSSVYKMFQRVQKLKAQLSPSAGFCRKSEGNTAGDQSSDKSGVMSKCDSDAST